jgi:hypothetical protein
MRFFLDDKHKVLGVSVVLLVAGLGEPDFRSAFPPRMNVNFEDFLLRLACESPSAYFESFRCTGVEFLK